jgi:hypothetical protein
VRFNLNSTTPLLEDAVAQSATTDEEGRAAVSGVRPGSYRLVLWDERISREMNLTGNSDLRFVLPTESKGTSTLAIRLLRADQRGASALVYLHPREGEWARVASPDGGGNCRFDVSPGSWVIHVPWTPISYEPRFRDVRREVVLREGQTESIELMLGP